MVDIVIDEKIERGNRLFFLQLAANLQPFRAEKKVLAIGKKGRIMFMRPFFFKPNYS